MRRTIPWLVAAAGLLIAACSDSGNTPDSKPRSEAGSDAGGDGATAAATITSDDGKAKLAIPAGALPSGVSAADIKLTALVQSDVYPDLKGWTWIAGYKLEPDGTTLSAPAQLAISATVPDGGAVIALHQRVDDVEVPPAYLVRDSSTGMLGGYTVELSHFSTLIILDHGAVTTPSRVIIPARDRVVGETFSVGVELSPPLKGEREIPPGFLAKGYPAERISWDVSSWRYQRIFDGQDVTIEPDFFGGFGADGKLSFPAMGSTARIAGDFKCRSVGPYDIGFRGNANVTGTIYYISKGQPTMREDATISMNARVQPELMKANCVDPTKDGSSDCLDSVSTNTCSFDSDAIAITGYDGRSETIDQDEADAAYGPGGPLACGRDDASAGVKVVCPAGGAAMPAGDVHTYTMVLKAAVPLADTGHSFIYSLVLDSDGNAANDWKAQPPYNWDYFQGTDRWFQLIWDHIKKVWSLTVTQVDAQQKQNAVSGSTVRAVIAGNAITFKVAAAALSAAKPGFRMSAFGHDGKFSVTDRGGDVTGADPTQPLAATK